MVLTREFKSFPFCKTYIKEKYRKNKLIKVPKDFADKIFSLEIYNKKLKNNNKDESDSDEYDANMDLSEEIIVKVSCDATTTDRKETLKYAVLILLDHIVKTEKLKGKIWCLKFPYNVKISKLNAELECDDSEEEESKYEKISGK